MTDKERTLNPISVIGPALLSVFLFIGSMILPPTGLIAPAPLYYVTAMHGMVIGLMALLLGSAVVSVSIGFGESIFYIVTCGLIPLALAQGFLSGMNRQPAILRATMISLAGGAIALVLAGSFLGQSSGGLLTGWADSTVDIVIESYKTAGVEKEVTAWVVTSRDKLVKDFVDIIPALFTISMFFTAVINVLVIRVFSLKYGWNIHFDHEKFTLWQAPDQMVWGFVAGGVGLVLFEGNAATIAFNLTLVVCAVYFIQGVALAHFFMTRWKTPIIFRAVVYFFIFSQPMLMLVACFFGLTDVWADFRKIRAYETTGEL